MQHCAKCGYAMDVHTCMEPGCTEGPKAGDVGICAMCGEIHMYDADGTLRPPTYEEYTRIATMPMVQQAIGMVALVQHGRRYDPDKLDTSADGALDLLTP